MQVETKLYGSHFRVSTDISSGEKNVVSALTSGSATIWSVSPLDTTVGSADGLILRQVLTAHGTYRCIMTVCWVCDLPVCLVAGLEGKG
jgi:hypothetical protein